MGAESKDLSLTVVVRFPDLSNSIIKPGILICMNKQNKKISAFQEQTFLKFTVKSSVASWIDP